MVTPTSPVKLTHADYWGFPEDGPRHEIIDGELFVTAAPFIRHQRLVQRLGSAIQAFLDDHPLGEVLPAPCAVVLSAADVVEPDLLFVSAARSHIVGEREIRGAPDLVVEILSDSTRRTDEVVKRNLYGRAGVREYWVIDPVMNAVTIYRQGDTGFHRPQELTARSADELSTPLLPGFSIPLAQLFR